VLGCAGEAVGGWNTAPGHCDAACDGLSCSTAAVANEVLSSCTSLRLQTVHDGRIYTLKIYCDEQYPDRVRRLCWPPEPEHCLLHSCYDQPAHDSS